MLREEYPKLSLSDGIVHPTDVIWQDREPGHGHYGCCGEFEGRGRFVDGFGGGLGLPLSRRRADAGVGLGVCVRRVSACARVMSMSVGVF